jgi:hypothetical protein
MATCPEMGLRLTSEVHSGQRPDSWVAPCPACVLCRCRTSRRTVPAPGRVACVVATIMGWQIAYDSTDDAPHFERRATAEKILHARVVIVVPRLRTGHVFEPSRELGPYVEGVYQQFVSRRTLRRSSRSKAAIRDRGCALATESAPPRGGWSASRHCSRGRKHAATGLVSRYEAGRTGRGRRDRTRCGRQPANIAWLGALRVAGNRDARRGRY